MSTSRRSFSGFTIVELLIVIVVIGILAAITIVAYSSIQTRAQNTAKLSEVNTWQKLFEAYRATSGTLPSMPDGGYCLGSNFPVGGGGVGRCRDYGSTGVTSYLESANTALMTEIAKIGSIPASAKQQVNGTVGPYAEYTATNVSITMVIKGTSADCPAPTNYAWDDGAGRLLCRVNLTR